MHCQDKTILRVIARKLRKKAAKLEAIAYEQEKRELASSRHLIDPLLLEAGKGGNRTTTSEKAFLIAMDRLRQAGLA